MSVHTPQLTLFPSAARTAAPTPAEFDAGGHHGCHVVIRLTAVTASPTLTPTVAFYDELADVWCTLLVGSDITATGTTVLKVYPGIAAVAGASASDCIHGRCRLSVAHADADSATYSASVHLIG